MDYEEPRESSVSFQQNLYADIAGRKRTSCSNSMVRLCINKYTTAGAPLQCPSNEPYQLRENSLCGKFPAATAPATVDAVAASLVHGPLAALKTDQADCITRTKLHTLTPYDVVLVLQQADGQCVANCRCSKRFMSASSQGPPYP